MLINFKNAYFFTMTVLISPIAIDLHLSYLIEDNLKSLFSQSFDINICRRLIKIIRYDDYDGKKLPYLCVCL